MRFAAMFATMFAAALLPLAAQAFSPNGLRFSHHDWELACDNTGTCRAAGYQADESDPHAVSVLLTRVAGAGQAVTAQVQIGQYGDNPVVDALPAQFRLVLHINGKDLGQLTFGKETLTVDLSPQQSAALVAALARSADIRLTRGSDTWQLSDKGAAAVLLKMDEYQGRIGTSGALLKKGPRPESAVPPAAAAPVIPFTPRSKAQPGDDSFARRNTRALLAALRAADPQQECSDLHERADADIELTASRLAPGKMLLSTRCWLAAYNSGSGYWVINDRPPFQPVLVTSEANNDDGDVLSAFQKGRGLGDCVASRSWRWDGKQFRLSEDTQSGMCRMIAPGGAWSLPTVVTR